MRHFAAVEVELEVVQDVDGPFDCNGQLSAQNVHEAVVVVELHGEAAGKITHTVKVIGDRYVLNGKIFTGDTDCSIVGALIFHSNAIKSGSDRCMVKVGFNVFHGNVGSLTLITMNTNESGENKFASLASVGPATLAEANRNSPCVSAWVKCWLKFASPGNWLIVVNTEKV